MSSDPEATQIPLVQVTERAAQELRTRLAGGKRTAVRLRLTGYD